MIFYLFILLFILLMSFIAQSNKILTNLILCISIIVLSIAAGTCENFSTDNSTYIRIFNTSHSGGYANSIEPFWRYFNTFLYNLGFNHIIFFLLSAFTIITLYFLGIKRLSNDIWFSIILFIVCQFYFNSLNIIRQYVAMSILFVSLPILLKDREYSIMKYLGVILFASLFHLSSLLCIPFIFISKIRYKNWQLIILMISTIVLGPIIMKLVVYIFISILKISFYAGYLGDLLPNGTSIGLIKVLIMNCIGILVILFSKPIIRYNPQYYILINMMVIGIILYNIFNNFLALMRVYLYFYPVVLILIPLVLESFTKESKILIKFILIIGYSILAISSMPSDYYFNFQLFR